MSQNTKFLSVAILVIAIGGSYFFPKVQQVVQQLGANPGPDSTNDCTSQNGLQVCKVQQRLATATSTSCALRSPVATSSLRITNFNLTTATSTAVTITVATSSTPFATTTVYNTFALGS